METEKQPATLKKISNPLDKKKDSSIENRLLVGATYLFLFKTISQVVSWAITFIVARLLQPADYGLLSMSTIITGFAAMFSELGLGAAIIQRKKISDAQLSSIFWLGFGFSILMAIFSLIVAYPTSYIFKDPRTIPLTQATSILFVITGLQIVPLSLLKKQLRFKVAGFVESIGVIISSISTLFMAHYGFGAWSLLLGQIIKGISDLIMYSCYAKWKPQFHFSYPEAKSIFGFGFQVMMANSFYYLHSRSDRFFAGRIWSSQQLGLYGFAKELAHIPTERFVSLINQVTFSGFSQLQHDKPRFQAMYLNVTKLIAFIVFPLFIAGFLLGDELIRLVLDPKWYSMSTVFRYFCLVELVISINSINGFVHTAQGRPSWNLIYNTVLAVALPLSFWLLLNPKLESIIIPWFAFYVTISIAYAFFSLKKAGIPLKAHLLQFVPPVLGTAIMVVAIMSSKILLIDAFSITNLPISLAIKCLFGFLAYISYIFIFNKKDLNATVALLKKNRK